MAVGILFYRPSPHDLTPPYWVAMGATAITVLAGARIVAMASAPAGDATRHLIVGSSVLFWDHLPIVGAIGDVEGWFALAAWAVTFAAMLYHLYATLLREPPAPAIARSSAAP